MIHAKEVTNTPKPKDNNNDGDNNLSNSMPGKRKTSEKTNSARNAKRQKFSGPVISSLFRNNPVIPQVER